MTNTVSGEVTRFVYDGNGNRVLREDADGLTAYIGAIEVRISATERVTTSYYFVGSQRIAMRVSDSDDGEVTYQHGDHLGSASLATDATGVKISDMRYRPFGETRYGDAPTDRRFTGQREESSLGLGVYDYNARFYSAGLGRFLSADVIVPSPGNPQSFNRYAYTLNNPLKYTDPTGRMSEWDWQNRWYNAHGYFWDPNTGFWSMVGDPVFADVDIAREVIGEAGIELGGWEAWSADNIQKVAFGVAKFGQRLSGGMSALKSLLGGGATIQLANKNTDWYCGWGKNNCAPPGLLRGGGSLVLLLKSDFDKRGLQSGARTVVHELAHVIDWQNNFSRAWMNGHIPITQYSSDAPNVPIILRRKWEVWADAVMVYVFGSYDAHGGFIDHTGKAIISGRDLTVQMSDMQRVLEGW